MQNKTSNIIIADSQFLISEGLRQVLQQEFESSSVIQVNNNRDLLKALDTTEVSLLIIDFHHIEFDSISEMKGLLVRKPEMAMMVLVNSLQKSELAELNRIGISNILLKNAGQEEMLEGIRAAMMRRKHYGQKVLNLFTGMHREQISSKSNSGLTHSEIEIIKSIAGGFTTKQIALLKNISHHTVMTHRKNIFKKLSVNNASELVMFAIRNNIVDAIDYQI